MKQYSYVDLCADSEKVLKYINYIYLKKARHTKSGIKLFG